MSSVDTLPDFVRHTTDGYFRTVDAGWICPLCPAFLGTGPVPIRQI
ncbi:hypothetical protein [Allocoleopsis franciscana]|nr:hypothetical protein [Allocoleopsis franciscana]